MISSNKTHHPRVRLNTPPAADYGACTHLKSYQVKHDSYDDRWVYCNIGTNYSVPLVVFDPFWTWDPSINTELLNITLEVLREHPELTPHLETLWGDVLPVSTGQYSERASDVWDWIYRNIGVNVKVKLKDTHTSHTVFMGVIDFI